MGMFEDVLAWMDNKRRVAGRNVSDLVSNPKDYLSMTAANIPQTVKEYGEDPMNFVGGGIGRIKIRNQAGEIVESIPTQASMAGNLHSLGLVNNRGANALYNLGGKKSVDPELLALIESEMVRRGRVPQLDILRDTTAQAPMFPNTTR